MVRTFQMGKHLVGILCLQSVFTETVGAQLVDVLVGDHLEMCWTEIDLFT